MDYHRLATFLALILLLWHLFRNISTYSNYSTGQYWAD